MITVIIPTSAIPTNPSTDVIKQVIETVQKYLPDSQIIVTCDGIRSETEHRREAYEQFTQNLVKNFGGEVDITIFTQHQHQTGMLKEVMDKVRGDIIFYVEHDWILKGEIPFDKISQLLLEGQFDLIRLLYPTMLPPYHKHMMIDLEPIEYNGVPIVRTWQWSQNPHLASKAFYERIIAKYFGEKKGFIEEVMTGRLVEAFSTTGGFKEFKVGIYVPKGDTQRVVHIDGRHGEVA